MKAQNYATEGTPAPVSAILKDRLLSMDLPVMAMPHATDTFQPLKAVGHRLLLAGNGLFKEIRRPWLYARFKISDADTPFGDTAETFEISADIPQAHLDRFLLQAREHAPKETAAWLVWDEDTKNVEYVELVTPVATYSKLTIQRPLLPVRKHLILDLHSHHTMDARFSGTDDKDDKASGFVTISGVVGTVDTEPTWAFRMCLEGELRPTNIHGITKKGEVQ